MKTRLLALAASNNPDSINRELVAYAASQIPDADVTLLDMQPYSDIPLYSPVRQQRDGFPPEIQQLYALLKEYDGILLASPEYNGSMPAAFKNVVDWISRIDMQFFGQKPLLLLSTSPGPNGGASNLRHLASLVPFWGAQLTGSYSLGSFQAHFDRALGRLDDAEQARLQEELGRFSHTLSTSPEPVAA